MKKNLFVVISWVVIAVVLAASQTAASGAGDNVLSSWASTDVGSVKSAGSARQVDSGYEVSGSGGDVFGTADAFHFIHQSWKGDGVMIAHVLSIAGPNGGGKAGLMIRSGLNPDAVNVFLAASGINRLSFQSRSEPGEQSQRDVFTEVQLPNGPQQRAEVGRSRLWSETDKADKAHKAGKCAGPWWLKLIRRGNDFSAYSSTDGINWQWLTTERVMMPASVELGLAVTSFKQQDVCVAKFDQVSVQSLGTEAPALTVIGSGSGEGIPGTFQDRGGNNVIQRVSPTINFDWSHQTRHLPGVDMKSLSATWEGYIETPLTEPYALQVVQSGCARLWIDGNKIIDDCPKIGQSQAKAMVLFKANEKHAIRLEYSAEKVNSLAKKEKASVKLMWSSPSTPKQIIPKSQLYAAINNEVKVSALTGDGSGLQAGKSSGNLALPWLDLALGSMTNADGAKSAGGGFVAVGGHGVAGRAVDEGRFVHQSWQGDVEISACLSNLSGRSPSARVGVMIRENLKEESAAVFLEIDPKNRARIFYRKDVGHGQLLGPYHRGGTWLKLVRQGDSFTAFESVDGTKWVWLGSVTVPMSSNTVIGCVVGSDDPHDPYVATFTSVRAVVPATVSPWVGDGDGLGVTYADKKSGRKVDRVDPQVNFVWGNNPPMEGIDRTNFTVHWEGLIQAQYTEPYRIFIPSDMRIKLWLDGKMVFKGERGSAAAERRVNIRMKAGQFYAFRLDYEHAAGPAMVRLLWSSAHTAKQAIPQSQLYSPKSEAFSKIPDKDHDGIPDYWELVHGLNPYDGSDAFQDADGDGLANLMEYQLGSDPQNADSNGDGIPDGVEVYEMGINPATGRINKIETVFEEGGSKLVGQLGDWSVDGDSVYARDVRGWVEYLVTVPKADMYRLEIAGGSHNPNDTGNQFDLEVSLDGQYLGRSILTTGADGSGTAHPFTPWIKAGEHRLRIYWDNGIWSRSLKLTAVRVQKLVGDDLNNNGISDWVETRLNYLSGIEVIPASSAVSPVCIEGRDRFLDMMKIAGGIEPQGGISNHWYANVPLNLKVPTAITCSFQNGGLKTTNQVVWSPTSLLEANDMVLRAGDALLLTAFPAGTHNGTGVISVTGVTNYTSKNDSPTAHQFTDAGTFAVVGTYTSPSGQVQTKTISVKVVSGSFDAKPAVWVGKTRTWQVSLPAGLSVQGDPRLKLKKITGKSGQAGRSYKMTIDEAEKRYIVARVGTNGPIVANVAAEGFRLFSAYETGIFHVSTYPDGSELAKMDLILSPVLPQVKVKIELIAGGVQFEDGTTAKVLLPADFDELGRASVRFIRPPAFKTSVCHTARLYQGDVLLGTYP